MSDLSWADFDQPNLIPVTDETKRCRYCKLTRPSSDFERWPDSKDGLHYFCTDCWSGFCRQGKARGLEALTCAICQHSKPIAEFYRECVFGNFSAWCNLCRSKFISDHTAPKPPKFKSPQPPKLYACQKCREIKPAPDFGITEYGNRCLTCKMCREEILENKTAPKAPKQIKYISKTKIAKDEAMRRAENSGTQICCVCVTEKYLSEFPSDPRKSRGVAGCCNKCRREKQRIKTKEDRVLLAYSFAAKARAAGVHDTVEQIFIRPSLIQEDTETFRCRKCQQSKPLFQFAKAPRKEGHDLWCKECSKERKKKWHQKMSEIKIDDSWERKAADRCNQRARKKGLPYGMKPADLYDQKLGALPVFCPYFPEIILDYNHGPDRRHWASVDKIVPALGYVSGNVCVASMTANTWKSNGSSPTERARIIEILSPKKNQKSRPNNQEQNSLFD